MRKSFTWFLSLMVLLFAFGTSGYAQEEQETVELYAENASSCYMQANDYTVNVAVRDFIKLTEFDLGLSFNDQIYTFVDVTDVNAGLLATVSTVTPVSGGPDVLNLTWSGTQVSIGDDVTGGVVVMKLHFKLKSFPGNTAITFPTDLKWTKADFYYTKEGGVKDRVNTVTKKDGSLTVDVGLTGIETELTSETCAGGDATVTVTAPEADMYLFNEDPVVGDWEWTDSNEFLAAAGETVRIRVKDADGCISLMEEIEIPASIDPVSFTVEKQDPLCYDGKGAVVINATGGTAPYTYWISPNSDGTDAKKKTNFQFSQGPGTYYVNVDDVNNCAEPNWVMVTIVDNNTPVVITETVSDVLCYGESTGSIAVDVTGDETFTMVSIDGNAWEELDGGTYTFADLEAGTYTVWAKNANDCEVSKMDIVVVEPEEAITFDIEIDDTSCGGLNDGTITVVDVMGGTAPYEYSTDGGDTWQAAAEFSGLLPKYYSLWVQDANECVVAYQNPNGTGNKIAVQSPSDIMYDVVVTDPLCNDGTASIAITNVTGGTGSYSYSFDNGTTWVDTMTIDEWEAPYDLPTIWVANEVEGGTSCAVEYETEIVVTNPTPLMADITGFFAPTCIDNSDGDIQLQVTGGVEPYWYSLNGGNWKETDGEYTSLKVPVGTHEIMVKDANDCEYGMTLEQEITLEENIITAATDLLINCYGDKTGEISVTVTSWAEGVGGRNVDWYVENEGGAVSSFNPSNQLTGEEVSTKFNAGTYIVWGVDQYTCQSNPDTIEVLENAELKIDDVMANGASCFNVSNGVITIHASGGTVDDFLEYAFVESEGALGNILENKWLDFDTYDPETTKSTVTFNVNGGTYWVAVRDNNCGEVAYGPIEVAGYEELLVDETKITMTDPMCFQDSSGTITVPMIAVSGGAGAYKFTLLEWVEGEWIAMEDYMELATGEFTGLGEGSYAVWVEDAENCPSYTTVEDIMLTDPDALTFTVDNIHFSCVGSSDGVITVTVDGGTGDFWYAINNKNTWVAFAADTNEKTYIATEPGTYKIWVKDDNGCETGPKEVEILEPEALSAEVTVDMVVSCYGGSDGEISVTGMGGWDEMSSYEFAINDGDWSAATVFTGLPGGTHTLYIRDVYEYTDPYQYMACIDSVEFTIEQPDPILYDVVIEDVKCKDGDSGTFTVNIISGGTPFVDEEGDEDGFWVRLTGDAYEEEAYTGTDNSYEFKNLAHSHYTLYITDAAGCTLPATIGDSEGPYTTEESWEVQEPNDYLTLDPMWIKDVTCYDGNDGQFVLNVTGGSPDYTYHTELSTVPTGHVLVDPVDGAVWQDNDTFNVGAGTWVVWVTDANGCIVGGERDVDNMPVNKWRVEVEQPDSIVWDFHTVMMPDGDEGTMEVVHYVQPSCNGKWDGQIHLVDIMGGSGTYNAHVWGTSAAGEAVDTTYMDIEMEGESVIYMLGGVPASDMNGFEVMVLDENGCTSAVDTIMVDQPEELMVTLQISEGSFTCYQDNEGWIEATVTGGTEGDGYEYKLWRDGVVKTDWQDIASAFLVKVGHGFVVEVRDANECTIASDSVYIETPMEVSYTVEDLSCSGNEYAVARIHAMGTPGREFRVWYQEIENDVPSADTFAVYNGWFAEWIQIDDVFEFDNENYLDRHYAVYVEDENGCVSPMDTLTFDAIQTTVSMNVSMTEITECSEMIEISYNGGIGPHVVMVNDSVLATGQTTYNLPRGIHIITVMDDHMCTVMDTIEVMGEMVTVYDTVSTYYGDGIQYVNDMAIVDSMLIGGDYTFMYMDAESGCERTLMVNVWEMPYTIAMVQGDGGESPVKGKEVKIAGTVTGIAAGEGFFVQDASAAWSGVWVEYSAVTADEIAVGDGVEVLGEVGEVADVTTIVSTAVSVTADPMAITPIVLANPDEVGGEMYESVLVTVEGARATETDAGTGEWNIYYTDGNATVNDWLYSSTSVVDHYYDVTGVVNGRLDNFKLEPRMESDVIDLSLTAVEVVDAESFKAYPNPFNDRIIFDNNEKLTRVVISNIAGQRVIDVEYPEREIRTDKLVSGVYLISMFTEKGIAKTERMVKR